MRIFCLSLCLMLLSNVRAQVPAVLHGVVLENTEKGKFEPIVGAIIHWMGNQHAVTSDSAGVFRIPLDANSNRLIVQALGFKTDTIAVTGKNNLRIMMISKRSFGEAVVTYERKSTEVSYLDPWKTTIMGEKELFKAACCNLSESFETNPSVDVAYNDAVTGSKQIQMLGLGGQYMQMSQEQLPGIRGLAGFYGLSYIPGSWINSIQVSKGAGSVVNGYESISGQINVELHKPISKDKLFWNSYVGQGGRYETNLVMAQQPSKMFSHALMLHGSGLSRRMDNNNDGFLDNPLGYQGNILYRMFIDNKTGWVFHASFQYLQDKKTGGVNDFEDGMQKGDPMTRMYGTRVAAERISGFAKIGYVFPASKYRSIGLQLQSNRQNYDNYFGENIYKGEQLSNYANLIFQDKLFTENHKIRSGVSLQSDKVDESFLNMASTYLFNRNEVSTGAFTEYTWQIRNIFTLVAGVRFDHDNLFGNRWTPRLHVRYAPSVETVIRASAGKGWRTSFLLSENMGAMVSSRQWLFGNTVPGGTQSIDKAYGFAPEEAWNFGINLNHEYKINFHKGSLGVDYYYTRFNKQVVVDRETANQLRLYSLQGASYSHSLQLQTDYQPIKRFDVRFAYRWYDVKTQYEKALLDAPMIARHRWFLNLAYTTRKKWNFDLTINRVGAKRLPSTEQNPAAYRLPAYSDAYYLLNAQVSKKIKTRWDVYLGCENVLNYIQPNAILDAAHPYGSYFDASLIWGPVFGRMFYAGFRYKM